jgi:hypothetical protein
MNLARRIRVMACLSLGPLVAGVQDHAVPLFDE